MNTNIFDESNVEVLDTNEDNNFIYESIHIKNLGHTFKTRTKKSKLKRTNETVPQIHIEDFIVSSGMAKEANKETMEAFFKTPAIKMQRAKIEIDSDSGDTWMDFDALSRGLALAVKTPKYTELSWNARGEGLLYIAGLISVTDGAILANFLFNDHQFSSIAETNGVSNILLNGEDGSGHLASGNVIWDALGNLSVKGAFESNNDGNRIIIDPNTRSIKLLNNEGTVIGYWSFSYDYCKINMIGNGSNLDITPAYVIMRNNTGKVDISPGMIEVSTFENDGQTEKTNFSINYMNETNTLKVIAKWLPTSAANLEAGQVWNDNGTLKIK